MSFIFVSSSDDEANRTFEGMDIDNYDYPKKVWSTPVKKVRNEAAEVKKNWDKRFYDGPDSANAKYFKKDQFEYDKGVENELQQTVQKDPMLKDLFQGLTLKVLVPEDYRLLTQNGQAYCMGTGFTAKVFVAENMQTKELVCIKAFQDKRGRDKILEEIGYFNRGQRILAQDPDYVPLHFRGFLKLKQNSQLIKEFDDLVHVTTVASLVPNVPVCLSLETATVLLVRHRMDLSIAEWASIIYRLIKATCLFYNGLLTHGDLHAGNVCLTYVDGVYKLGIIDFGFAKYERGVKDLTLALDCAQDVAEPLNMDCTIDCIENVSRHLNINTVLKELHAALSEDVRRLS